jgi:hypothetical protein
MNIERATMTVNERNQQQKRSTKAARTDTQIYKKKRGAGEHVDGERER